MMRGCLSALAAILLCVPGAASAFTCWDDLDRMDDYFSTVTPRQVSTCLITERADPNYRDRKGFTPLHLLVTESFVREDIAVEIIRLMVGHGADPNALMGAYSPLRVASELFGEDSEVYAALSNSRRASASTGALYGAIAVGELRYLDEGERYRIPSVIGYDASSIDDAVRNAKNTCNKRYPKVKLEPGVNECFVYLIFSSGFSARGHHQGKYHTSPGRCGAAMKWRVTYQDGSENTFFNVGAGRSREQARDQACRQYRDNEGGACSDLTLSVEKCNSR